MRQGLGRSRSRRRRRFGPLVAKNWWRRHGEQRHDPTRRHEQRRQRRVETGPDDRNHTGLKATGGARRTPRRTPRRTGRTADQKGRNRARLRRIACERTQFVVFRSRARRPTRIEGSCERLSSLPVLKRSRQLATRQTCQVVAEEARNDSQAWDSRA